MNKKLLVGMFSVFMAVAPWQSNAAQTIDAPHLNVDSNGTTEDCTYCHFASYQPSDCGRCHSNNNAPYGDGTAPLVSTHKGLSCQACHNPHVSQQQTGIVGNYSGIQANTPSAGMTTLTGVTPTPDQAWAEKTGPDRGMILWVNDGADNFSFEVKQIDAAAGTVTVKGNLAKTAGTFDLRRGQLIAKKVTKTGTSYRQGDLAVEFPSKSASIFIDTQNASNPTGICQVCHTTTKYWTSTGAGMTHNADRPCTTCHQHASGFQVTGCTSCHPGPAPDGAPTKLSEMASPSTGSQTAGQHLVHATPTGYNFPCATCHVGTGMDRANPSVITTKDGIQLGFNWAGYSGATSQYKGQPGVTYAGTNQTQVDNTGAIGNGSMVCSNTYCHSNGKSVRLGCTTPLANASPAWDGSSADPQGDAVKCNNCHGYDRNAANIISSGRHTTHVENYGIPCWTCHADTAGDDGTGRAMVANKTTHVNGAYDIKGGMDPFRGMITLPYEKTTKTCGSATTCHQYDRVWEASTTDTETCSGNLCTGDAMINLNPIVAWQAANVDDRTLVLTDISVDPDLVDPVKNQCQGSGFDGSNGLLQVVSPDPSLGNFVAVAPLKGTAQPAAPVVRSYSDAYVDRQSDPLAPRVWFYYRVSDNGPGAFMNTANPTPAANSGWSESGWQAHILNYVDMAKVNALPIMNFTPNAVNNGDGTYTFTVTDSSIDPDYNDAAKAAYMGGGHDGGPGYAQILLSTGGGTGPVPVTFTNAPGNTVLSTNVSGKSGDQVWYLYVVYDNHYSNPAAQDKAPSYVIYSGWKYYVLP